MKRKRLTAKRKSELCVLCGKCCMAMTFYGGEVNDESRDEIHWMELHGFKIDYVKTDDATDYYFSIPQRCNALQEMRGDDGLMRYTCGVYETRPQMCRDYDAFVGNVERIEPQYLASAFHLFSHRNAIFVNLHIDFRSEGDLVQCRRHAAARRIAQTMNPVKKLGAGGLIEHIADQRAERR